MKKNTILLSLCILFLASCSLLDTEPQDFVTRRTTTTTKPK